MIDMLGFGNKKGVVENDPLKSEIVNPK